MARSTPSHQLAVFRATHMSADLLQSAGVGENGDQTAKHGHLDLGGEAAASTKDVVGTAWE